MNRKEKIKLLQAVNTGLLMPEDIRPAKFYIFKQDLKGGWKTECPDNLVLHFTDAEIEEQISSIEAASQRRVNCGLDPDLIIRLVYVDGKTIL